jgi:hypothetical protein
MNYDRKTEGQKDRKRERRGEGRKERKIERIFTFLEQFSTRCRQREREKDIKT